MNAFPMREMVRRTMHVPSRAQLRGDAEAVAKAVFFILLSEIAVSFLPVLTPVVATVVFGACLPVVVWVALGRRTAEEFFLLIRQRARFSADMVARGAALTVLYCAATVVAQVLYVSFVGTPQGTSDIEMTLYRPYGWMAFGIAAVVLAPFVEEAALRGFLQGRLEARYGGVVAVTVAAVLFAALHLSMIALPLYFIEGLALGYVALRTRSIWVSVAMHASQNLAILVLNLRYGPTSSAAEFPAQTGISLTQFAVSFAILVAVFARLVPRSMKEIA